MDASVALNPAVRRDLERLTALLPLAQRQTALAGPVRRVHRAVLGFFADQGRAPDRRDLMRMVPEADPARALEVLAAADLVVLDARGAIVGSYPFSALDTPHRLFIADVETRAMCALDAVAVAPALDREVNIVSECRITGRTVRIHQQGEQLVHAEPGGTRVGIHWQEPRGCAARSLCMEMVFLADAAAEREWAAQAPRQRSVYMLPEAVAFGAAFFRPLLTTP